MMINETILKLIKKMPPFWIVIGLAATIRLLHLACLSPVLGYEYRLNDGQYFDALARAFATGSYDGKVPIVGLSPIYVWFLSLFYFAKGYELIVPRIVQILLGALSCGLLQQISLNLFGNRAGWIAGLMAAFCGVFIYFDAILIKASLTNFFWILALWALIRGVNGGSRMNWSVAGAGFAAACLLRMQLLLVWPWMLLSLVRGRIFSSGKNLFFAVLIFLFSAISVFFLSAQWFQFAGQRTQGITSMHEVSFPQTGIHFYLGNHAAATGTYKRAEGIRASAVGHAVDARQIAEKELGRNLSANELNLFWLEETAKVIRENPWRWAKLEAKKFFLIWNAYEVPNSHNYEYWRRYSLVLSLPLFSYGLLAPLAILGWVYLRGDKRPTVSLLKGLAVFYILSLMLTFVTADYRLPLHPLWILFASCAVDRFIQDWQGGKKQVLRFSICLFILFFIFCNYQTYLPKYRYDSYLRKWHDNVLQPLQEPHPQRALQEDVKV